MPRPPFAPPPRPSLTNRTQPASAWPAHGRRQLSGDGCSVGVVWIGAKGTLFGHVAGGALGREYQQGPGCVTLARRPCSAQECFGTARRACKRRTTSAASHLAGLRWRVCSSASPDGLAGSWLARKASRPGRTHYRRSVRGLAALCRGYLALGTDRAVPACGGPAGKACGAFCLFGPGGARQVLRRDGPGTEEQVTLEVTSAPNHESMSASAYPRCDSSGRPASRSVSSRSTMRSG
jgi:hypothetical protein